MSEYASETSDVRAKNVVKCPGGHDKIRTKTAALMTASTAAGVIVGWQL